MCNQHQSYRCLGPFEYGHSKAVCVHGWNIAHTLSADEADKSDSLTNAGLLPARQRIQQIE